MSFQRAPAPALLPFATVLWASDGEARPRLRERVLPTGAMHLVIRLDDAPLRLFSGADDAAGHTVGTAVVGGARAEAYLREVGGARSRTVGVQLRPGAASVLLGAPAGVLAGRHVTLEDLWGREAARLREQLAEAPSPAARLALLEAHLVARIAGRGGIPPALEVALHCLSAGGSVSRAAEASGFSHRHFLVRFREEVGLAPKAYGRVLRLQRVLQRLTREPAAPWVDVALDAGFADQAHLARDFRELTGLTPSAYRSLAPAQPHHVPLAP